MTPTVPELLKRFPGQRILVVGDVVLDEYLSGPVRRLSPEAPVPVVELALRRHVPGGAANTAANVAGLHGQVALLGVTGADQPGRLLRAALEAHGIAGHGLLVDADRPTTTKTRIVAGSQQLVRVDHEQVGPLPEALEQRLLGLIDERLPGAACCVLADYAKGVVSATLARHLIGRARELGKPVLVDPKGSDFAKHRDCTLVKPNLHEAALFLGREVASLEDVHDAGHGLLTLLGSAAVLLTRGAAGMALFEPGRPPLHLKAQAREVYDVTGAGDTVAATLALAVAAGATLEQAARLAGRAAAVTVARAGTAAVRLEDLLAPGTAELS